MYKFSWIGKFLQLLKKRYKLTNFSRIQRIKNERKTKNQWYGIVSYFKNLNKKPNFTHFSELDTALCSKQNGIGRRDSSESNSTDSSVDEGQLINGNFVKSHGISWIVGAFFIVGEVGGGRLDFFLC